VPQGPFGDVPLTSSGASGPAPLESAPLPTPEAMLNEAAVRLPEGAVVHTGEPLIDATIAAIRDGADVRQQYRDAAAGFDELTNPGAYYDDLLAAANAGELTPGEVAFLRTLAGGLLRRNEAGELNMPMVGLTSATRDVIALAWVDQWERAAKMPEGAGHLVVPRPNEGVAPGEMLAETGFEPDMAPVEAAARGILADPTHTVVVGANETLSAELKRQIGGDQTPSRGKIVELNNPNKAKMLADLEARRMALEAELGPLEAKIAARPEVPTETPVQSVLPTMELLDAYNKLMVPDEQYQAFGDTGGPGLLGEVFDAIVSIDEGRLGDRGLTMAEAADLRAGLVQLASRTIVNHGGTGIGSDAAAWDFKKHLLAQARAAGAGDIPDVVPPAEYVQALSTVLDQLDTVVAHTGSPLDGYTGSRYELSRLPRRSKFDKGPLSPRLLYQDDFVTIADHVLPGLVEELQTGRQMTWPRRLADSRAAHFGEFLFGARSEHEIHRATLDFFTEELLTPVRDSFLANPADYEYALRDLRAVYSAWNEALDEHRLVNYRVTRRVGLMRANVMTAVAERTLKARHSGTAPDWWALVKAEMPEVWRHADSRLRRHFAGQEGGIGKYLEAWYGSRPGRKLGGYGKGLTVAYHTFRFLLDTRWLALEATEAPLLVLGRAGPRAAVETIRGSRSGAKPPPPLLFGADVHARVREAWAWWVNQTDPGATMTARLAGILQVMRKEQPETLGPALLAFARSDAGLASTIFKFGDTPESWLRGLNEDLEAGAAMTRRLTPDEARSVYGPMRDRGIITDAELENIVAAGHYTRLPKLEAELAATIGDPAVHALIERLHFLNEQLWNDIAAMMFGQPDRSNFQRIANHPLLYWPLSYQIKATKWLANVLMQRSFGMDLGAAPLVLLDQLHAEMGNRLATDPGFARWFKSHEDLFFLAQMLIPITPWDIGVSLSPFTRLALAAGSDKPYQRNLFGVGPGYTYFDLLPRLIAAESKPGGIIPEGLRQPLQNILPPTITLRPPASTGQARTQQVVGSGGYMPTPPETPPTVPRFGP
jgi:hypothetical protein